MDSRNQAATGPVGGRESGGSSAIIRAVSGEEELLYPAVEGGNLDEEGEENRERRREKTKAAPCLPWSELASSLPPGG